MDIGKRVAEFADIVCAIGVVYDIGDKKGWWPLSFPHDPSYLIAILVVAACSLNVWALRRNSKPAGPAGALESNEGIPSSGIKSRAKVFTGGKITSQPM